MTTITEVSRALGVSTRMLRYYEQQGMITSARKPDYAYRVYDAENVNRLRIILVLRKLRVPLAAIAAILTDCDADEAVAILQTRVQEVEGEMRSLAAIREVLSLRPIREFELWLEKMGIMHDGRLTDRAGDPTIFTGRR